MAEHVASPRVRLRRSSPPFKVELTPLIDVVFLLLTFFIYAMVLMERIELVPMELRTVESGGVAQESEPAPALTLSLDIDGTIYLDRDPIAIGSLLPTLDAVRQERPDTVLYLAVADQAGTQDRVPALLELWDLLRMQEMPVKMVGKPASNPTGGGSNQESNSLTPENATINP